MDLPAPLSNHRPEYAPPGCSFVSVKLAATVSFNLPHSIAHYPTRLTLAPMFYKNNQILSLKMVGDEPRPYGISHSVIIVVAGFIPASKDKLQDEGNNPAKDSTGGKGQNPGYHNISGYSPPHRRKTPGGTHPHNRCAYTMCGTYRDTQM